MLCLENIQFLKNLVIVELHGMTDGGYQAVSHFQRGCNKFITCLLTGSLSYLLFQRIQFHVESII